MTTLVEAKNEIFDYVRYSLGEGLVDVELDPIHYETAFKQALARYRQRSTNSVEESYSFLELIQDQNEYRLPDEIIEVRQVFRRAIGSRTGMGAGGTLFEPFNLGTGTGVSVLELIRTFESVNKIKLKIYTLRRTFFLQ